MDSTLNNTAISTLWAVGDNATEWNVTDLAVAFQELMCHQEYVNFTREDGVTYCNSTFDSVTCWPTTTAGQDAVMPCPPEYGGVKLHHANVTKHCFPNGTWAEKAAYNICFQFVTDEGDFDSWVTSVIFYTGYTISTVALLLALFIFWYFKTLRCRRNIIHCHLMLTFAFKNMLWLLMSIAFLKFISVEYAENETTQMSASTAYSCRLMVTVYNYLQVASFFWMFVEGLYLHTMIVWAFSADKVKFWMYALLGWGVPVPIILIWVIVKSTVHNSGCWLPDVYENNPYEFIYIAPILLILLVNIIFMASIEIVLITKLKATNGCSNNQEQRQYKRAVKGTVILFPLLGLIYVFFITPPGGHPIAQQVYTYTNAILQSFQGLLVALFYCFLNTEVRHTISKRVKRWKERRSVSLTYSRGSRGPSIHKFEGNKILLKTTTDKPHSSTTKDKHHHKTKSSVGGGVNEQNVNGVTEMSYIQDCESGFVSKEECKTTDVAL